MLRITIDGQQLDLEGIKFTLQLNSPIPFNPEDGLIEGSFAFGVALPASATNKSIFGFPHRLERFPESNIDFKGEIFFDGRLLFKVIISLTEVSDWKYRTNIKVDLGYYTSLIADKSLKDLVFEGTQSIGSTMQDVVDHANQVVTKSYPEVTYNFPTLYNPKFYGEEKKMNLSWQDLVNFYIHGHGFQVNSINNDNEVHNYYNLCPFPYLFHVLKACYTEFGFNPIGEVFKDVELSSLLIYNNYALDLIEDRYTSVAELTSDQEIPEHGAIIQLDKATINIDSCYNETTFKYLVTKSGDHQITAKLLVQGVNNSGIPAYAVDYTVWLIKDGINLELLANGFITDPYEEEIDINKIILLEASDVGKELWLTIEFVIYETMIPTTGKVFVSSWAGFKNVTWSSFNMYQKSINLTNHVPDIKISNFLISLMKAFGIVHAFDNKSNDVHLYFLRDILSDPSQEEYSELVPRSTKLVGFRESKSYRLKFNWNSKDEYVKDNFIPYDSNKLIGSFPSYSDLPTVAVHNDIAIVLNLFAAYRFINDTWEWFSDLHYPLTIGSAKTSIDIDCTPLTMYDNRENPFMPKVYPRILQEGSSTNLGLNEFGFHLLFYRGLLADVNGDTYPFASCTKYGPTGSIVGNYQFILDGPDGLYETFLENYYDFVMNKFRPVKFDRLFSAAEIQSLDFIRKKRIFQQIYFLDEISIPITNEAIGVASMKLIKS